LTFQSSTSTPFFGAILLGVLGSFLLWKAASKATSGVPGRFQAAVEILYEMVDTQAKGIIHNAKAANWYRHWPSRFSSGFSC
jgi:F0F1-type ATP synthase membrane subunit a